MKRKSYIYKHIRKDKDEVFYVGMGSTKNFKRAYSHSSRNTHWKRIVNITDYEVQIVKENLTWDEACEIEIKLIKKYGRRDLNEGSLVNMTDGGEGSYGVIMSDESKLKMSLSKSGSNHPRYGKTLSNEYKKKLSDAKIGDKCYLYGLYGKDHPKHKEVLQLSMDSEFIKKWDSVTTASRTLNVNKGNISSCCNEKLKSAGGYIWRYI